MSPLACSLPSFFRIPFARSHARIKDFAFWHYRSSYLLVIYISYYVECFDFRGRP